MVVRFSLLIVIVSLLAGCSSFDQSSYIYTDQNQNTYEISKGWIHLQPAKKIDEQESPAPYAIRIDQFIYAEIKTMLIKATETTDFDKTDKRAMDASILHFTHGDDDDSFIFDFRSMEQIEINQFLESLFKTSNE